MTAPDTISPTQLATDTLELLRAGADEAKAASYQRFFKEPVNYYGLDNKSVKEIKQDVFDKVGDIWTIDDAVTFCETMLEDPHMEARGIGFQVVAHLVSNARPDLLSNVRLWLEERCGNWGLVDNLAPTVLAPLIELYPQLVPEVVSWTESPSLWLRRGAVVAFVPLVGKSQEHRDTAYRIVSLLLDDSEDLIHKATGWLLREAGKANTDQLVEFLLEFGPRIPRTAVRYAIERFPKDERKHLLQATRKKR